MYIYTYKSIIKTMPFRVILTTTSSNVALWPSQTTRIFPMIAPDYIRRDFNRVV